MLPRSEALQEGEIGLPTRETGIVLGFPEQLANIRCWIGHVERTNDRDYEIEERYVITMDDLPGPRWT
jgi:hypothetical protein